MRTSRDVAWRGRIAVLAVLLSLAGHGPYAAPPAAPALSVSTTGQRASLLWNAAAGAAGYVLYYAPYPNAEYIGKMDMGTATSFSADLPPGAAYYTAIRARNADGESAYSNIGTVLISAAGFMVLNAGDYWEYEWTQTIRSSSTSGSSTSEKSGTFRITLGAPQSLGGRTAYPINVSGDAVTPVWKYLAADGPDLLGTVDGNLYSVILGGNSGGWKGSGFFSFHPASLARVASSGSFQGNYRTTPAWVVSRNSSSGGCTYYAEVGQSLCIGDPSSYSESEYEKAGVGTIGFRSSGSASSASGVAVAEKLIELVKSSRVAEDGTVFTGTPWSSIPPISRGSDITGAAAWNGKLLAFGGYWDSGGPPWVQAYDPLTGTWGASTASGAEASVVVGVSGGVLYGIGRSSSTAATSLLRFDGSANLWNVVRARTPSLSNPCGGAVVASGDLAVLDCPGLSSMTIYVYSPATGLWRSGVSTGYTILRPAVAAVGDDVYVAGGYDNTTYFTRKPGVTGDVWRFRTATGTWDLMASSMPTPRDGAVGVAVGNKVYLLGGTPVSGSSAPSRRMVEILDTASGTWSTGPVMPQSRYRFVAAGLGGKIYVIGGYDSSTVWLTSAIALTPY